MIEFGRAIRFENGKGVLLPTNGENTAFQALRQQALFEMNGHPKMQEPHITLMHPRNSTCTDDIFEQIKKISLPKELTFKRISLIEQQDGGRWNVLQEFELKLKT